MLDTTDEQLIFGPGSGKYGGKIVKVSPRPKPIIWERNQAMPIEHSFGYVSMICGEFHEFNKYYVHGSNKYI